MTSKRLLVLSCALVLPSLAYAQEAIRHQNLDEVLVHATRSALPLKRLPGKVEVIQAEQIARQQGKDLTTILKEASALDVVQYPGFLSNVGIRGFAADNSKSRYVPILINGIPSGTANLSTIGLAGIEQIEVLKGPYSSIYGTNAMGGVINIITRKSTGKLRGALSSSFGSFSSGRAALALGGSIAPRLSFDLNVGYDAQGDNYTIGRKSILGLSQIERAVLDPSTRGAKMPLSNYSALTASARLGYQLSAEWSLDLNENLFLGKSLPSGGTTWGVYGESKKDLVRTTTSLELSGRMGQHHLQLTPYLGIETSDNYNSMSHKAIASYVGQDVSWGAILQDKILLGRHVLVLGADSKNSIYKSQRFDDQGQSIVLYNPDHSTHTLGLFAQGNLNLLDERLNISGGLRADFMRFHMTENALLKSKEQNEYFQVLSPNLGIKYSILPGLTAHATIGSAFTAPDAIRKAGRYETAWGITQGNPELQPERSLTYDAGIGYSNHRQGIQVDLNYFNTTHKDMIISNYTPVDGGLGITSYENAERARMSGIELVGAYDFGSLVDYRYSLRASVNATWMLSSEALGKGKSEWTELEGVRKYILNLGLDYTRAGWQLGLSARLSGQRQERYRFASYEKNGIRTGLSDLLKSELAHLPSGRLLVPGSLVVNAHASYQLSRNLQLALQLNNLLDEQYMERDGYHMPGRNMRLSATYKF